MRDDSGARGTWLGEFASADAMLDALRSLRHKGYTRIETFSPYPVPGAESLLGLEKSRLPLLVFAGGVTGAVASYAIQWWANAYSYPLDIGGRPAHATTAFIVPTFEGTIFLSAITAFLALFAILRLPRLWRPVFEIDGFERATIDRFWIAIDVRDRRAAADLTPRELESLGALRVVRIGSEV